MNDPKFIVFEGIDGSGKTTQLDLAHQKLIRDYPEIKLVKTREASDGPIGTVLRNTYLAGKRKVDEKIINLLYAADRFDHIMNEEDGILKTLSLGVNVLCDRYYYSSLAYDTYMHIHAGVDAEEDEEWYKAFMDIYERNLINMQATVPDLVIYLDTDPNAAVKRLTTHRNEISIYESVDKQTRISLAYQRTFYMLNKMDGPAAYKKLVKVDGNRHPAIIAAEIYDIIKKEMELK